jgi:hypothetical protein
VLFGYVAGNGRPPSLALYLTLKPRTICSLIFLTVPDNSTAAIFCFDCAMCSRRCRLCCSATWQATVAFPAWRCTSPPNTS